MSLPRDVRGGSRAPRGGPAAPAGGGGVGGREPRPASPWTRRPREVRRARQARASPHVEARGRGPAGHARHARRDRSRHGVRHGVSGRSRHARDPRHRHAGYESGKFEVSLAEGARRGPSRCRSGPATGAKPPALVPPAPPERAPAPVRAEGPSGSSGLRTAGWVTGAVGLASLGVGTYFGVSASSSWSSAKNDCKPGACAGRGATLWTRRPALRRRRRSRRSTVIGGGVALATGVLLYILGRATAETPRQLPARGRFRRSGRCSERRPAGWPSSGPSERGPFKAKSVSGLVRDRALLKETLGSFGFRP